MADPQMLALASALLAATALMAGAALKGWQGWLDLKRAQLSGQGAPASSPVAELRRRVRRLEAIAEGAER